nr:hypothetical protein [uncultured Duncaniella sp.]
MLDFDSLPGVSGSHLVTGMTEYKEGNQDECREQHGHYRKALFVGHIVADLSDFGGQSPLGAVPHLII